MSATDTQALLFLACALQGTATHGDTLQHNPTHYNILLPTATHCNTLQNTAKHCNMYSVSSAHTHFSVRPMRTCGRVCVWRVSVHLQRRHVHFVLQTGCCRVLQCITVCCSGLQWVAVGCSIVLACMQCAAATGSAVCVAVCCGIVWRVCDVLLQRAVQFLTC